MSTPALILLLQGILFLIWAFLMFRALFGIQRRYREETGKQWIGPVAVFRVYGGYLRDRNYRREKQLILGILVLLIVVSYFFYQMQSG